MTCPGGGGPAPALHLPATRRETFTRWLSCRAALIQHWWAFRRSALH